MLICPFKPNGINITIRSYEEAGPNMVRKMDQSGTSAVGLIDSGGQNQRG